MLQSYPRWTTLDFLDCCDPRIRSFYEYWDGKRGGRNLPSRSDLDPAEMSSFLPSIMLVDVIEPSSLELWYSLVGTMEAQARGGDPTGRLVRETFIGRSVDHVLENYRLVITSAGPIYDSDEVTMDDEFLADAGSLLLPLSDNGRTVSKVIVFAALGRSSVGAAVPRRSELSRYPGRGLRCLRFPCRTPRSARGVIPQAVEALNLLHATSLTRGQGENCRHLLRLIKRAPPGF